MNAEASAIQRRSLLRGLLGSASRSKWGLHAVRDTGDTADGVCWEMLHTVAGELLVVGDDGHTGCLRDGEWSWQSAPGKHNLHALCEGPDGVIAVGWLGAIYQRQDENWILLQGGGKESDRCNTPLFSVTCDSAGTYWAVGDQGRILRGAKNHWQDEKPVTEANLRAVATLPGNRVLAAGLNGTLLLRDDERWRLIETQTQCPLVSIAVLDDEQVLLVGGEYSTKSQGFVGRVFLLKLSNGHIGEGDDAIAVLREVDSGEQLPRLRKIRAIGDDLLMVGDGGFAVRWNNDSVSALGSTARYDLHDAIYDGKDTWFCGDCGSLFRLGEINEAPQDSAAATKPRWQVLCDGALRGSLRSVWSLGDGRFIAGGDEGRVAWIEGDAVHWETLPIDIRVQAFWSSSPRNLIAAGDNGSLLHHDGKNWDLLYQSRGEHALLAVTGFGPHDVLAVGDNGYALRYDGLMWKELSTGVRQELYGLWGHDAQHVLAVGGGGLVLRFNGESFKVFQAGTDQDLYGVAGTGLERLFVCGLAGTLIHFAENRWQREFTGTRSDLHALATLGEETFCVGSYGTVLRRHRDPQEQIRWTPETTGLQHTLQAINATEQGVYAVGSNGVILRRRP